MFGLFKSSAEKQVKKLQKEYQSKLGEAMQAQRNGDIRSYSMLSEEADKLYKQLMQIKP
jgi:mRNA-degrading endonuclease RelE of RelBE toxin-antitoxin system